MKVQALGTIFRSNESLLDLLPRQQAVSGKLIMSDRDFPFQYSVLIDDATAMLSFNVVDLYEVEINLDSRLKVMYSRALLYEDKQESKCIIDAIKHDERVTEYDPGNGCMTISFNKSGTTVKKRSLAYTDHTLDGEILKLFLQAMIIKNAGDFKTEVVAKVKGRKANAEFKFFSTADCIALANDYTFPEQLRAALKFDQEVLVYQMRLKGIAGWFYPYKFYSVFEKEYPHGFLASWGKAMTDVEYTISGALLDN